MWRCWAWFGVGLAACEPMEPFVYWGDDDASASGDPQDSAEDSDRPIDSASEGLDSGQDTVDASTDTAPTDTGPQALGCHPYDPMTTSGWERRYSIVQGGRTGTEIHRGQGMKDAPSNWPGNAWDDKGYAHTVTVNLQGATNPPLTTYFNQCQSGSSGEVAVEVGYAIANGQQADIVVGAREPRVYLPSEQQFAGFGWSDTSSVRFRLFASQLKIDPFSCLPQNPPCVRVDRYSLDSTNNVATDGQEQLTLPGLGSVSAQKITYAIRQTVTKDGGFDPFGTIFDELSNEHGLSHIFRSFQIHDEGFNAEITRWYVRGVGLVKEQAVDIHDGSVIASKELTQCSGLPGC